jgi:hypothetical protein
MPLESTNLAVDQDGVVSCISQIAWTGDAGKGLVRLPGGVSDVQLHERYN